MFGKAKQLFAVVTSLMTISPETKEQAWERAVHQVHGEDRAQAASRAVNLVVALTVGGIVAAFLLPVALDEIVAVDVTNYSTGAQSLWNILDLIIVLAVFLFFIGLAMARSKLR